MIKFGPLTSPPELKQLLEFKCTPEATLLNLYFEFHLQIKVAWIVYSTTLYNLCIVLVFK